MTSGDVKKAIEVLTQLRNSLIGKVASGGDLPTPGWFEHNEQDISTLTRVRDRLMAGESTQAGARK